MDDAQMPRPGSGKSIGALRGCGVTRLGIIHLTSGAYAVEGENLHSSNPEGLGECPWSLVCGMILSVP